MLEIGSIVDGKYKILRVVGKGGMSVVYQAVNERANKIWAIKEVRKDGVQNFEVVKQNLIVETDLLKRFNHPNLPSIIDVIDGDGRALVARRLKTETESIFSERKITASSVIFFSVEDDSEEDNTELKAEDYLEKYKVDSVFFILAVSLSDSEKDLGEALLRCFAEISSRLKRDVVIRAYFFNEGYGECARALFSQPEPTEAWFEAFSPDAVSGFAILDGKPNVSADYLSEKLRYNSNGEQL